MGTPVRSIAEAISPRLAKAALAAIVDDRLVDLTYPAASTTRTVRILTADGPRPCTVYRHSTAHLLAAAVTSLFPGTQCGIGPANGRRASSTTSSSSGRSCPKTSSASRRRCASWRSRTSPYEQQIVAARRGAGVLRQRGEPLKVQLIDEKTEGQTEVSCYTIKDRDLFVDFCVGPHVPSTSKLKALQAADDVERLLEGRRAEPADAAGLRDGLLQRQGTAGPPDADRGSQEARSPQARQGPGAVHRSTRGRPARRSG